MGKRLIRLAFFASLCILLFMLPMMASAEQSGTCGDKLTWELDDEGTLRISGTGSMNNYANLAASGKMRPPWRGYQVKSLVIDEGVTSIGEYAFMSEKHLESIQFPESLLTIGKYAFYECTALESISLPDAVTTIGTSAFERCSAVRYANRSGASALALTSAYYSFVDPEYPLLTLKAYQKKESNRTFTVIACSANAVSVSFPEGVTSIASSAFSDCDKLTDIIIPDSVTGIAGYAFSKCDNLTTIVIPDSVTSIADNTFQDCVSLQGIDIPDGVTAIGISAFSGCAGLKNISIPDGVKVLNSLVFDGCSSLADISIPKGLSSIGEGTFRNCSSLAGIDIPEGVTEIGRSAFAGCSSLVNIRIPDGITVINYGVFQDCSSLEDINIPDDVTIIGQSAFSNCSSLKNVQIPVGVSNIGYSAFSGCKSLEAINIPDGITVIEGRTFTDCSSLKNIDIPDGVISIGASAFYGCLSIDSVNIPDSVTEIGDSAFKGCESLKSIRIPDDVTVIGGGAFGQCASLKYVQIPDGVTAINNSTFAGCKNLTNIDIPNGVTSIGDTAFSGCINLTGVNIPDGVTSIGSHAFFNCICLNSVSIPASVTRFGEFLFDACPKLEKVVFYGMTMPSYTYYLFDQAPTIYCYQYSDVDFWAEKEGYSIVYLDAGNPNAVLSIAAPTLLTLGVGESYQIPVTPITAGSTVDLKWSSSSPAVAVVDQTGRVSALKRGTTVITIRSGDISAQTTLSVVQKPSAFDLSEIDLWMISKETAQLKVVNITPADTDTPFVWSSSDTDVCTVSADGLLKALRSGTATVTVTSGEISRNCTVHVVYPVTAIAFTDVPVLYNGSESRLTVEVTSGSQIFINKLITFASSDKSVAVVDQNGVVHAVGAGSVTITATASNGVSASCTINVVPIIRSVLPAELVNIEEEAFAGASFEYCVLPYGIQSIGARAFADCTGIVRIEIPDSVTTIADDAFEGCGSLTILAPKDSAAHAFAIECGINWIDW